MKARQITGIVEDVSEASESEEEEPTHATYRVQVRQSPYLDMFYDHHTVRIVIDSGATGNMIRHSAVKRLGVRIQKSSQSASQADGTSPLTVLGEVRMDLTHDGLHHTFEGLVVENLDVEILGGTPFMESNDITIRPAKRQVILKDNTVSEYGSSRKSNMHHSIRRAHVLRAPAQTSTIWPGEYIEVDAPEDRDQTFAIEPSTATQLPTKSSMWPLPSLVTSVARRLRIPNLTTDPLVIKKNAHVCKVYPVFDPKEDEREASPSIGIVGVEQTHSPQDKVHSSSVSVDPDNIFPVELKHDFTTLLREYDEVFSPKFPGYNGKAGPFQAVVNMGPTQPPQRKGRLPQYARSRLVELQHKFDELEELGVFKKPEDIDINVEYLNPSFLINKPSGGTRLVTAFADVGRYSKPQPSLLPNVDSTLQQIGQWKYIICSDLSKAFYQIPLSRESMHYCGVATPFRGVRVYVRCAMGMPGSETALEELMCRVLGDLLQEGIVAKLADDLYCGADSVQHLLTNWRRVLDALRENGLRLSASKTIVGPKSTTILGWNWQLGTIEASSHRIATLTSCSKPTNVKSMRSFIGAYKILSRVLPQCSGYMKPLDEATAGLQSKDPIKWSEELCVAFREAQNALSTCKNIVLPKASDKLWIVTDGSVKMQGIGATLYVVRDERPRLAGFYSAKLRDRQVLWLPCEVEALAISSAVHHFSPFIVQSQHNTSILTDSKPCVQAFEKLCRGEFSASPRVTTFLSAVSRYQASVRHIKGIANVPSDHASRNPPECNDPKCQVCLFIAQTENSVVRQTSVQDVLSGKVRAPFTNRGSWASIQAECQDLRRTRAHLTQGTRPTKKLTNIRDIKRYLQVASIAKDGLLVVKRNVPLAPDRDCLIVPRFAIDGLLTALHLQLEHPSEHQLKSVVNRYMYALDMPKAVEHATKSCHLCASLQKSSKALIEQSTGDPPESLGILFAADVLRRERQLILVVREYVSSFTVTRIVESEKHEPLRDAIIMACVELCPLNGPPCVVRTDCAKGFQALCDDKLLQKHNIRIELGRTKNINKNPVADKAIWELEEEIVKMYPRAGPISSRDLAIITARLNTRIRSRGLSSREMWQQRDQFTNEQIPLKDRELISAQHKQRVDNHKYSETSKAGGRTPRPSAEVGIGDVVYLYSDGDKHRCRDRYIVVSTDGPWCNIKKFSGAQLRNASYRIKRTECYVVPSTISDLKDRRDEPAEEEDEELICHPAVPDAPQAASEMVRGPPLGAMPAAPVYAPPPREPPGILCEPPPELPGIPDEIAAPLEETCGNTTTHSVEDKCIKQSSELSDITEPTRSELEPVRRSSRAKHMPLWHKDYVDV